MDYRHLGSRKPIAKVVFWGLGELSMKKVRIVELSGQKELAKNVHCQAGLFLFVH